MHSGWHQIVETSDDAIVSKDLDGIITSWNRGAERLFGYSAQEIIGKPVTILIPEDRIDEEPEILDRIRRGERIDHYDTVRRRKNGSLIDISLTISPLKDADGRIIGASKIARDITERKRAQEQQKLLLNEMQHRIKNSLATIQAIATQTLNAHAKERDAFIARLHALGSAHDLLTSEAWEQASLPAIVTKTQEPSKNASMSGSRSTDLPIFGWTRPSRLSWRWPYTNSRPMPSSTAPYQTAAVV